MLSSFAVLACATCFGDPNSVSAQALSWAILTLLGIVLLVLTGIAALIISFWKRRGYNL